MILRRHSVLVTRSGGTLYAANDLLLGHFWTRMGAEAKAERMNWIRATLFPESPVRYVPVPRKAATAFLALSREALDRL